MTFLKSQAYLTPQVLVWAWTQPHFSSLGPVQHQGGAQCMGMNRRAEQPDREMNVRAAKDSRGLGKERKHKSVYHAGRFWEAL